MKDLTYKAGGPTSALMLTTQQNMPDALKRAITLMLFSNDPDIRNFNGNSIVLTFPTITNGGFDAVSFNLTMAAKRLKVFLEETNPEVSDVYFATAEDGDSLSVTLNVVTSNNTQTAVVYA